jgi:hypothetical protein
MGEVVLALMRAIGPTVRHLRLRSTWFQGQIIVEVKGVVESQLVKDYGNLEFEESRK